MINQILQDSLIVNQSEKYHLTHLSLNEVEDIVLNCNEFDFRIKILIEQNKTTFEVTGKAYDRLVKIVKENKNRISWVGISCYQKLSEDFVREFKDKIDWYWVSFQQKLSEEFIREFQNKIDWFWISHNQILSEDFIREFKGRVCWANISSNQKLSEEFIREFQDVVNWLYISQYQKLSRGFLEKFHSKINWRTLCLNKNILPEDLEFFRANFVNNECFYTDLDGRIFFNEKIH